MNSAAEQVSLARPVSDSSQNLSQGAAEQASSIEQLTASMSQISAQTKQMPKMPITRRNWPETRWNTRKRAITK